MAYTSSGKLPIERASKLGHVKFIREPRIQRLLEAFERTDNAPDDVLGEVSGHLDLAATGEIENVVAIDGSHVAVPNVVHNHKRLAFVSVAAVVLSRRAVAELRANPIVDPRELKHLQQQVHSHVAVLPLAGVALPGETVVQTIRATIDDVLRYTDLYPTLQFLVGREWLHDYAGEEHMECLACGDVFPLPRSRRVFLCPHCGERHTLADYLRLVQGPPEDWAREEVAIGLRNVLETLLVLKFLQLYRDRPIVLRRTLFVKDGPLLLRAQLSRLVEPIRAFLAYLHQQGRRLHLVGIEKAGALVDHTPLMRDVLREPGDFFLPSVRYLQERIDGVPFVEATYRNRVHYGSKVVVRLGRDHLLAANVPTGEFLLVPKAEDLYGFPEAMAVLSEMVSYAHENAVIPLVLANTMASISMRPSSDILESFATRLLEG